MQGEFALAALAQGGTYGLDAETKRRLATLYRFFAATVPSRVKLLKLTLDGDR